MGLALMLYNWATSKKYGWKGNGRKFNFKALGKSFIDSFWAILSPVIILGGIYGGFFTPQRLLPSPVFTPSSSVPSSTRRSTGKNSWTA